MMADSSVRSLPDPATRYDSCPGAARANVPRRRPKEVRDTKRDRSTAGLDDRLVTLDPLAIVAANLRSADYQVWQRHRLDGPKRAGLEGCLCDLASDVTMEWWVEQDAAFA